MGTPSKAADDVTGIAFDGSEGSINRRPSDRVIDYVKALILGVRGDILLGGQGSIVDWGGAQLFDEVLLFE
jgi:hypothetical protein